MALDATPTMIGAFIGFLMWLFASVIYRFRMPLWYLLLLMALMIFSANAKTYLTGNLDHSHKVME